MTFFRFCGDGNGLRLSAVCLASPWGVLNFMRQKPTYESSALIQVVYPNAEAAGLDNVSGSAPDTVRGQSRLDESRIIMSDRVIDLAIQLSDLKSHEKLSYMSAVDLRNWIKISGATICSAGWPRCKYGVDRDSFQVYRC